MATFLFDKIIFGPVKSRRLGVSLGVNLLPVDVKVCSFDCIYCECGFTPKSYEQKAKLPSRLQVSEKLEQQLVVMYNEGALPDVITFAGNGEPTMHPEFAEIIEDTIALRNRYAPAARIAVLSNATMLHKQSVFEALLKVDDNIQKLDSLFPETIQLLDAPRGSYDVKKVVEQLAAFRGKVIVQTLFVRGTHDGKMVDNTDEHELTAWMEALVRIAPSQVMIYTIARDTPVDTLQKVSLEELETIAERVRNLGFAVQVSA